MFHVERLSVLLSMLTLAVAASAQAKPQAKPKPTRPPTHAPTKSAAVPKFADRSHAECQVAYVLPHNVGIPVRYEQVTPPLSDKPVSQSHSMVAPTFKRIDPPPAPAVQVLGYHCHFDQWHPQDSPVPYAMARWEILNPNLATVGIPEEPVKK